eukprot:TRINITY_DN12144_c0_g1_i10.p2 TRINITY_DN12144_c0_g1~~TRINITY_DN12144_c0_g1_i10.p2  ORF type:complete len:175 (-),score=18.26 TRINITY_DN12144_c0_g1_i10:404-928(-)
MERRQRNLTACQVLDRRTCFRTAVWIHALALPGVRDYQDCERLALAQLSLQAHVAAKGSITRLVTQSRGLALATHDPARRGGEGRGSCRAVLRQPLFVPQGACLAWRFGAAVTLTSSELLSSHDLRVDAGRRWVAAFDEDTAVGIKPAVGDFVQWRPAVGAGKLSVQSCRCGTG